MLNRCDSLLSSSTLNRELKLIWKSMFIIVMYSLSTVAGDPRISGSMKQCSKHSCALAEKNRVPLSGPHFDRRLPFAHVVVTRCFLWCKHKRVRSKRQHVFSSFLSQRGMTNTATTGLRLWVQLIKRRCVCVCSAFRLMRPRGCSQGAEERTSLHADKAGDVRVVAWCARVCVRVWAREWAGERASEHGCVSRSKWWDVQVHFGVRGGGRVGVKTSWRSTHHGSCLTETGTLLLWRK